MPADVLKHIIDHQSLFLAGLIYLIAADTGAQQQNENRGKQAFLVEPGAKGRGLLLYMAQLCRNILNQHGGAGVRADDRCPEGGEPEGFRQIAGLVGKRGKRFFGALFMADRQKIGCPKSILFGTPYFF